MRINNKPTPCKEHLAACTLLRKKPPPASSFTYILVIYYIYMIFAFFATQNGLELQVIAIQHCLEQGCA